MCRRPPAASERVGEAAAADPRLGAAPGARPAAVRLAAHRRARRGDGQHPARARPRRRANMARRSSTCGSSAPTCPTARRSKARSSGCRPRASRKRARSAPQGAQAGADHPRRGRGRGRARSMPTAFGKDPEFYDFYRAMQSYRHDLRHRRTKRRADVDHPVAGQRVSAAVPRARMTPISVQRVHSSRVQRPRATSRGTLRPITIRREE